MIYWNSCFGPGRARKRNKGAAACQRKMDWVACWVGCLAVAVEQGVVVVLVVYWAAFWVAVVATLALPLRDALLVASITRLWRRWA
ncbi:hypothetical protein PRtIB026_A34340 [Pseudomonas sp. RtIB026]|nr:hypothetical protein PRtIB026_A34340 [Pseudomonas sp. RtIB026]